MEVIIFILCFLNGAALASCFFIAKSKGHISIEERKEQQKQGNMLLQWDNFLNYDGTARGQRDYEE